MSDAPEILWLWPAEPEDGVDKFVSFPGQRYPSGSTTYIRADVVRADLSDALLREAVEALGMAVDDLDEWVACGDSLAQAGFNMDGTADCAERARATLAKLRAHLEGEKE